ncbi:hypothetical protein PCURB6_17670 [Paenibacillus curdlanolyticus]|nr:hypothetical protein PCURB6_17670 [Paenibacillus curdlanolyticus]
MLLVPLLVLIAFIGALALNRLTSVTEPKQREIPSADLHPIVSSQVERLKQLTEEIGIRILITDGFRSAAEQDALYRQGREDEGAIVTNAKGGQSYHNFGLAVDFALLTDNGSAIWDMEADLNGNDKSDWMEVVSIAKSLGFEWGGDWESFPDYPHLQITFGYSLRELRNGADLTNVQLKDN